jgi:hypothetical protein
MVDKLPAMVSMEMTENEKEEYSKPSPPQYPYGLCISLCQDELEKLNLADDDLSIGDMLHLHSLAKVTSVSSYDSENGSHKRVELVLAYIAAEDEDKENKESPTSKLYKK